MSTSKNPMHERLRERGRELLRERKERMEKAECDMGDLIVPNLSEDDDSLSVGEAEAVATNEAKKIAKKFTEAWDRLILGLPPSEKEPEPSKSAGALMTDIRRPPHEGGVPGRMPGSMPGLDVSAYSGKLDLGPEKKIEMTPLRAPFPGSSVGIATGTHEPSMGVVHGKPLTSKEIAALASRAWPSGSIMIDDYEDPVKYPEIAPIMEKMHSFCLSVGPDLDLDFEDFRFSLDSGISQFLFVAGIRFDAATMNVICPITGKLFAFADLARRYGLT